MLTPALLQSLGSFVNPTIYGDPSEPSNFFWYMRKLPPERRSPTLVQWRGLPKIRELAVQDPGSASFWHLEMIKALPEDERAPHVIAWRDMPELIDYPKQDPAGYDYAYVNMMKCLPPLAALPFGHIFRDISIGHRGGHSFTATIVPKAEPHIVVEAGCFRGSVKALHQRWEPKGENRNEERKMLGLVFAFAAQRLGQKVNDQGQQLLLDAARVIRADIGPAQPNAV